MENSFSKNIFMVTGSAFLVIAGLWLLSSLLHPWSKNIRAEITQQPYARTFTVSAEGKVNAKPDVALIHLSVVSQGKTVKEVTTDGNAKMGQVIEALKKMGIDSKDITSTQYSLYPNYDYSERPLSVPVPPRIIGYNLTQEVEVKVRKLDQVETVLEAGVNAGANQIGQLSFEIDDPSTLKKEAREKAFATAKEKAQEMAHAAGVRLGRIVTFSEGEAPYPIPYANYALDSKAGMGGGVAASIEPGSKELNLSVSVTYEIE